MSRRITIHELYRRLTEPSRSAPFAYWKLTLHDDGDHEVFVREARRGDTHLQLVFTTPGSQIIAQGTLIEEDPRRLAAYSLFCSGHKIATLSNEHLAAEIIASRKEREEEVREMGERSIELLKSPKQFHALEACLAGLRGKIIRSTDRDFGTLRIDLGLGGTISINGYASALAIEYEGYKRRRVVERKEDHSTEQLDFWTKNLMKGVEFTGSEICSDGRVKLKTHNGALVIYASRLRLSIEEVPEFFPDTRRNFAMI